MSSAMNLSQASVKQVQDFLNSFDVVFSDCVIWYLGKPIPGAILTVSKLQQMGKRLYLVTNNSTISIDRYCEQLRLNGLVVKPEQVINSAKVISWYLKKIQFSDEAFVIASSTFRQVLIDDGIKLTPSSPAVVEGNVAVTMKAVQDRSSVKAVIVDFCLFFDWVKLAHAISCLERKDVLYICGTKDAWIVYDLDKKVLGPGPLINIITQYSGRTPIECAKPSNVLKDYILETCDVNDPKRCLFIGDTINHDMEFGALCGFQKMFVDTGIDTIQEAEKDKKTRPDFYIPSLELLHPIIDSLHNNSTNENDSH
ncbi:Phosphoglycolate phosphatase [Eufriesea mexicana]|uniref:Phosphoglycolate phosphatase n=1 Tax=Eufriesea mexicana TaxID=516756 RepID=A0A310SE19_9HYME|nr:Phosphoglycolate phosphatase [Eufriesea mexicana]